MRSFILLPSDKLFFSCESVYDDLQIESLSVGWGVVDNSNDEGKIGAICEGNGGNSWTKSFLMLLSSWFNTL
jgi:hypothetical protein